MNWWLLAGSLAGVLALTGVAWLLGLGGAELADADEAMRIAEGELPGFSAVSAELDADRQGAVVMGADGARMRVRRHGARFVGEVIESRSSRA
jgi:hypothetical protein